MEFFCFVVVIIFRLCGIGWFWKRLVVMFYVWSFSFDLIREYSGVLGEDIFSIWFVIRLEYLVGWLGYF